MRCCSGREPLSSSVCEAEQKRRRDAEEDAGAAVHWAAKPAAAATATAADARFGVLEKITIIFALSLSALHENSRRQIRNKLLFIFSGPDVV
jgi:hypothetical protein